MSRLSLPRRDRISTTLRNNRFVIAGELLFVAIVQLFEVWGLPAIFVLFPFGWLSLILRKSGWRDVGLSRQFVQWRTVGIGVLAGLANALFALAIVQPLVNRLGGGQEDLSQYASIQGNIPVLIVWILIGWILGAFAEEMIYRGYVLNRFADLLGHNSMGWTIGLLASSAFFAVGHANLGISGVVQNFVEACFWAALYLVGKRNLWLTVIGHGVTNTIAFGLMYLGLYPGM